MVGILVRKTIINPKGGHMKLIGTITVLVAAIYRRLTAKVSAAPAN